MHRRQPLPRLWMMTDERQGEALLPALGRLPKGSGIVFRHYALPEPERRTLFAEVRDIGQDKGCLLMLAGPPWLAASWGADGSHGWEGEREPGLLRSASVHNAEQVTAANRAKLDFVFVSPVFETRSHLGSKPLGPRGFTELAAQARMPVIALGGMNEDRARLLAGSNMHGWAGIDAWS